MPPLTFVDTNVLVYAHSLDEPDKRAVAVRWLEHLWRDRSGVVSIQVLQEFHVAVTRKLAMPLPPADARAVVLAYSAWPVVSPDAALLVAASCLAEGDSISFWDAMIVESARRAGADRLLTEDLPDGRAYGSVVVQDPFATQPSAG